MEPFRYHVYVCEQQKPEGVPCCMARGSRAVIDALRGELARRGLMNEVQVTTCGSLGLCERGPNMVVYPEGAWYSGLTPQDVPEIVESHFVKGKPVARLLNTDAAALKTEIQGNRDRFLAAQRARDAAGVLPDDVQQTLRAFMESRAALTALELNVFTALGEGATAEETAERIGAAPRSTEMLLNALVSMNLLSKQGRVFRNTPLSARFFTDGSPDSARQAQLHTANLWRSWSTLTDAVRAGTSVYQREDDAEWTESFIAAMHRIASERTAPVVAALDAASVRRMLDLGGGSGAYSIAFARANPQLVAEILDRPEVLAIAQRHIVAAGLTERVIVRPGDLRQGSLGSGYDLVFISAICHMLSPEENRDLIARAHAALAPGGRVAIQDFILNADKTTPRHAALFSLNMLVATEGGASYSEQEYAGWLREAGFTGIRRIVLPGPANIMAAVRG